MIQVAKAAKEHSIGTRSTLLRYLESGSAVPTALCCGISVPAARDRQAASRPHLRVFDQLRVLSRDGFAGMLEIVGSLLMLLGLFTRPVAFILSGEMAVGYFVVHARQGHFFMPALNEGELAVLYCFIFLFLAMAGGGSWSIDALLAHK